VLVTIDQVTIEEMKDKGCSLVVETSPNARRIKIAPS